MAIFETWDIVRVPFPYTDRPIRQRRPALVISAREIEAEHGLLWLMMITSAENRGWLGDVPVSDLHLAGLPAASIVRAAKIATVEVRDARRLGVLPVADRDAVSAHIRRTLAVVLDESGRDKHH
jgi:mRNA interferase MazF